MEPRPNHPKPDDPQPEAQSQLTWSKNLPSRIQAIEVLLVKLPPYVRRSIYLILIAILVLTGLVPISVGVPSFDWFVGVFGFLGLLLLASLAIHAAKDWPTWGRTILQGLVIGFTAFGIVLGSLLSFSYYETRRDKNKVDAEKYREEQLGTRTAKGFDRDFIQVDKFGFLSDAGLFPRPTAFDESSEGFKQAITMAMFPDWIQAGASPVMAMAHPNVERIPERLLFLKSTGTFKPPYTTIPKVSILADQYQVVAAAAFLISSEPREAGTPVIVWRQLPIKIVQIANGRYENEFSIVWPKEGETLLVICRIQGGQDLAGLDANLFPVFLDVRH